MRLRAYDWRGLERKLGLPASGRPVYGNDAYQSAAEAAMRRAADMLAQDMADWLWRTFWQMVTRRVQLHIGEICFHGPPDSLGVVEFGYMVRPLHRNHGYATEAARALVDWALEQPGVTALRAETERDNLASQRVLQKLGAIPDGETPDRLWWRISRPP